MTTSAQAKALTCHSCKASGPDVSPCYICKTVPFCPACASVSNEAFRVHQQSICFSITEPTSPLERLAAACVGGMGAVHQYVSELAFNDKRVASRFGDADARLVVAGVIWNDFPSADEAAGADYIKAVLVPIEQPAAPYLKDARFRLQPSHDIRWALAGVYKRMAFVSKLMGVSDETAHAAALMLERRAGPEVTHYHFMRAYATEPDTSVVERAAATAKAWYARALAERNVFLLGHLLHMIEDSFSAAHTLRTEPRGDIARVYFFGDQTDKSHSRRESFSAVTTSGSDAARRVEWLVPRLRMVLIQYATDRDALADLADAEERIGVAAERAAVFRDRLLLVDVFRLASRKQ